MVKFKKFLAVALSLTMVFAFGVTSFAADPESEGSQTGAGASEGHVDKEIKDFVLPVTTATTFKYTMDPERLIQATNAAAYSGATFPAAESDTGVYFLTDTATYGNESNTVQAVNKGAVDQMLTVTIATATAASTDIALASTSGAIATEDAKETGGTPTLYLGGKVGGTEKAISATAAEWKIKVAGNTSNYEVVYKDNAYSYEKKTTGLTAWKGVDIQVKGSVTSKWAIAADTTAPTLTVTWKFENVPSTEPTYDGTAVDYSDAQSFASCQIYGTGIYARITAGESAVASKLGTVTVNGATKTATIASSGAIAIEDVVVSGTTSYVVNIVYDGVTYAATVTTE